jgi:hypothetical protein
MYFCDVFRIWYGFIENGGIGCGMMIKITANRSRVGSLKKTSGGSGSHRRAKPEEAGTGGSSVKEDAF